MRKKKLNLEFKNIFQNKFHEVFIKQKYISDFKKKKKKLKLFRILMYFVMSSRHNYAMAPNCF